MRQGNETGAAMQASTRQTAAVGGLAGWLLERLRLGFGRGLRRGLGRGAQRAPRLALVERIALAPRQQLALVEAEGRRLLVATSPDGAPTFYALDGGEVVAGARATRPARRNGKPAGRVSW